MDHQHHRHTNSHGRRDSSTLRRTQTFATPTTQGEESSVSSLGSLPAAHIVAQQFSTSKTSSQRRVMMDGSSFVMDDLVQDGRKIKVYNVRDDPSGANQRYCPHCRKQFTNPWAVPKHVMVCFFFMFSVMLEILCAQYIYILD